MTTKEDEDIIAYNICCLCYKKNNIKRKAFLYCMKCWDYYCNPCVNIHAVNPATEGHRIVGHVESKGSVPSLSSFRCDQHNDGVLTVFCIDHNEVACAECVKDSHRVCRNLSTICSNVNKLYNRSEANDTKKKVVSNLNNIKEIKKANEEMVVMIDTALNSVHAYQQELQHLLYTIEESTVAELQKEVSRIKKLLAEEIQEASRLIDAFDKVTLALENAEENTADGFVSIKISEKLINKAVEVQRKHRLSFETTTLAANQRIKAYLQQFQLFGKLINMKPSDKNIKTATLCNTPVQTNSKLYKVTDTREIDVSHTDDKHGCDIWGSCITEEGYLLLVDNSNRKLKLMDLSAEKVVDYIYLIDKPRAVCPISTNEAAVSLTNNAVQIVSLSTLSIIRTMKFKHECFGLAHNKGQLFISDGKKTLFIHDMNGKELHKVTQDSSGMDIFRDNRHVAVSDAAKKVFVVDLELGLITLDTNGNLLSTKGKELVKASWCNGVCTHESDVFVCGYGTGIAQVGPNSTLTGQIGNVAAPSSLVFDPLKSNILVTKFESRTLQVLEMVR